MAGHGTKMGRKREDAIAALLSQPNVDQAARVAGLAPRTVWRWLQVPEFRAAYLAARRAAFGQAVARMQQMSGAAVSTLAKIMLDSNAPAASRVRAAESILDHGAKAIEIEDIEVRVSQLELAAEVSKSR
jgi:hypothetical protein